MPRVGEELRIRHANGLFTRWLYTLKNTDMLLLDDWVTAAMDGQTRADLLEIIDDRASYRATIITSPCPSNIGMSGSVTRPWPTPCWTG